MVYSNNLDYVYEMINRYLNYVNSDIGLLRSCHGVEDRIRTDYKFLDESGLIPHFELMFNNMISTAVERSIEHLDQLSAFVKAYSRILDSYVPAKMVGMQIARSIGELIDEASHGYEELEQAGLNWNGKMPNLGVYSETAKFLKALTVVKYSKEDIIRNENSH